MLPAPSLRLPSGYNHNTKTYSPSMVLDEHPLQTFSWVVMGRKHEFWFRQNMVLISAFIYRKGNWGIMVGKIMAPQRCTCPNPQNLWKCYPAWQRDFADVIKVDDLERLSWIILPGQSNHESLQIQEEGKRVDQRDAVWEGLYQWLLALKM